MITFNLSTIVIPTPAAFDEDNPTQQTENLCYVILQILAAAKTSGVKLTGTGDLAATIESFSASVLAIADMDEL